jgi:plasmid stabilization system protein ParE
MRGSGRDGRYSPAQDDILGNSAGIWSRRTHPPPRSNFVDAIEASVEQLMRMPGMGSPRELRNPALKGLRP